MPTNECRAGRAQVAMSIVPWNNLRTALCDQRLGPVLHQPCRILAMWLVIGQRTFPIGHCRRCWHSPWSMTDIFARYAAKMLSMHFYIFVFCLQCFDAVGWMAGRASSL